MIEHDAPTTPWQAASPSRFEAAPPRHFLLPAILLLIAEQARHGYGLAKAASELQLGRVDRPSVYRTLAQLEGDGLVSSATASAGTIRSRRVYTLTDRGADMLRTWMGVIRQERDGLDRVLERYAGTATGSEEVA